MKAIKLIIIAAVIVACSALVQVPEQKAIEISLDQVKTEKSQIFKTDEAIARAWFVEAVSPVGG